MSENIWILEHNLASIRKEFPSLEHFVYLISNSLGAVPRKARDYLEEFYQLWAAEGVEAWSKEWWNLSQMVGDLVALLLSAGPNEVTMMPHATLSHWVALSTKFLAPERKRNKIIMTDHDFPSSLYAVSAISKFMKWEPVVVAGKGGAGIETEDILKHIDERTLFVATSHVYFKSAYIQDVSRVASRARNVGALTVIDGYHAPGIIPVDVKKLGVDFYIGGCLKWLCGGPGNAFLYVRPELASRVKPQLTGWFAHRMPFSFDLEMEFAKGSLRFMSGTPPVPCLYAARAGLDIIKKLGLTQIRKKSLVLTNLIIRKAKERELGIFTPEEEEKRGGAVSLHFPHCYQIKKALEARKIKVDFRKGKAEEPDIIRVGPHFYNTVEEIETLFNVIDDISSSGEFKKYPEEPDRIT